MAENPRQPVAVRIVRPYDTEEAFLESELETVGKTSVILIGAHARPQGVILRFEVTLQTGAIVLRGEGRVLQHKESAFRGQAGLALRFTRLDPKSKALVDRAAAIREARLSGSMPPQPAPTPPESNPSAASGANEIATESSSNPISIPDPEPTPTPPRPIESRPPTKPPPAASEAPPNPLVAMPSFAPMSPPSSIPSNLPSGVPGGLVSAPPAPPNATVAPDPMLAQILTQGTPPPPAVIEHERPTSRPPPGEVLPAEEAKTRPGKVAQLVEEPQAASASANVHATTTVAAPPLEDDDAEQRPHEEPVVAAPTPPTPPPPAPPPPAPPPAPKPSASPKPSDTAVTRVADRDGLLARLRERRASMSDTAKEDILRKR
ncbi:MAG: hypothetical protein U0270_25950 [Labilithrix sp.]